MHAFLGGCSVVIALNEGVSSHVSYPVTGSGVLKLDIRLGRAHAQVRTRANGTVLKPAKDRFLRV